MIPILGLAVLDQVDPPGALVEMPDGALVEVASTCLPADPREGEPLRVTRRSKDGCPVVFRRPLSTTPGGTSPHDNRRHP
ncbi:MAG TPA: hypothetical protein QGF58_17345 [Myxococcota bacterium]|nr:hypothetical protein [Myxococcota bacterium]